MVVRSSAETEYRGWSMVFVNYNCIRIILNDLKIKLDGPMKFVINQQSALPQFSSTWSHRTKHIDIDKNFINEKLNDGSVPTVYVPFKNQLTDKLTKGFLTINFEK